MDGTEAKTHPNPKSTLKTYKLSLVAQISLRVMATAATFAATWITLTSKQTVAVFGMVLDARYSYSSAFKFFAYANIIGCAFSALSLFLLLISGYKFLTAKSYFCLFLHDLIMTTLMMAGCAAATAVGYIAQNGNNHTGWMPVCDNFSKFCHKVTMSVAFSYASVILYLVLTIISADTSR